MFPQIIICRPYKYRSLLCFVSPKQKTYSAVSLFTQARSEATQELQTRFSFNSKAAQENYADAWDKRNPWRLLKKNVSFVAPKKGRRVSKPVLSDSVQAVAYLIVMIFIDTQIPGTTSTKHARADGRNNSICSHQKSSVAMKKHWQFIFYFWPFRFLFLFFLGGEILTPRGPSKETGTIRPHP